MRSVWPRRLGERPENPSHPHRDIRHRPMTASKHHDRLERDRAADGSIGGPVFDPEVWALSPDPLLVVDSNGRILSANRQTFTLARDLAIQLPAGSSIQTLLRAIHIANAAEFTSCAPSASAFALDTAPSGASELADARSFRVFIGPKAADPAKATEWIVQLTDVTSLVATPRGREDAVSQRDRLVDLLSHDLRSPNIAILAVIAQPGLEALPEQPRRVIEKAARRALHMIDSSVRRIRAESVDYVLAPIDLRHILEEAIDLVWVASREANTRIELQPSTPEFVVMMDRGLIIQVFAGLFRTVISHGVDGQPASCALAETTMEGGPAVGCTIMHAFREPSRSGFDQGDDPSARRTQAVVGDSESLSFATLVVERHGGTLTCATTPGAGRKIVITLPLAEPNANALADIRETN